MRSGQREVRASYYQDNGSWVLGIAIAIFVLTLVSIALQSVAIWQISEIHR